MNKRQAKKIVQRERIMFDGHYDSSWDMLTDSEREAARIFYSSHRETK